MLKRLFWLVVGVGAGFGGSVWLQRRMKQAVDRFAPENVQTDVKAALTEGRAAMKAKEAAETYGWAQSRTVGSAVASDAFFPFADGLLAAAEAGATAIIQPGGSIRDDEVIAAADEAGLAMVFTGMRHFRH